MEEYSLPSTKIH